MAARGKHLSELGRDDAAAADRRVADDADVHGRFRMREARVGSSRTTKPSAHRQPAQRAELCVAALDQLTEERRVQACGGRRRIRRTELAGVALERLALLLVVRRDVDHERRLARCR